MKLSKKLFTLASGNVLQSDVDKFKEYHNSHTIQKPRHAVVSGIPDIMYFLPEEFGKVNCLKDDSPQKNSED